MTTAHRPTWNTAIGTSSADALVSAPRSGAKSVHQLPAHMKLKHRVFGQASKDELSLREYRRELEEREKAHFEKAKKEKERKGLVLRDERDSSQLLLTDGKPAILADGVKSRSVEVNDILNAFDDEDSDDTQGIDTRSKNIDEVSKVLAAFDDDDDDDDIVQALEQATKQVIGDAADNLNVYESSSDEDSDEDDEEELMRELERIKKERAEEKLRKEREMEELAKREETEAILRGNPLLSSSASDSFSTGGIVKRRFGDDTVFSHTHSSVPETKKRFINDVVRSDFHRSFLRKFVQ